MALRHLILFHVRGGTPRAAVDEAISALRALADLPGILEYRIEESSDTRKGVVIVENVLFADDDALQAFRTSPEHEVSAAILRDIADWVVGDYLE